MAFIVTGAARGMGAATARLAASRGARVALLDVLDDEGEAVASAIGDAWGVARYWRCDLSDPAAIESTVSSVADEFGGVDVLHNNAAILESAMTDDASIDGLTVELFQKVIAINLQAPFLLAKHALPHLRRSSFASIINASSTGAGLGYPGCLAYGASKGGISSLTRQLAVELAPAGIRVNAYCPELIRTSMIDDYLQNSSDPAGTARAMTATHLVNRFGEPDEVAELVCFLASRRSSYINGTSIMIDGGSTAWRGTVDQLGM
jgi:NAD(P)-dependent dehydrogenase (short-subunit alcohol dehydrogenase family)